MDTGLGSSQHYGIEECPGSAITCQVATSVCEKGGDWTQALDMFSITAGRNVHIDAITCNVVISACEKGCVQTRGGPWVLALYVYDSLCSPLVGPSGICLASVIITCNSASAWAVAGGWLYMEARRWLELEPAANVLAQNLSRS